MIISTRTTILRLKRHGLHAVADQNTHRQTLVNLSGGYPTPVSNWVNKGQLQGQRAVESKRAKLLATQTCKRQRPQSTRKCGRGLSCFHLSQVLCTGPESSLKMEAPGSAGCTPRSPPQRESLNHGVASACSFSQPLWILK